MMSLAFIRDGRERLAGPAGPVSSVGPSAARGASTSMGGPTAAVRAVASMPDAA